MTNAKLVWRADIQLVFVVSGILFILTDCITEGRGGSHGFLFDKEIG